MNSEADVPKCEKCGGTVRPDVVLYEEGLDEGVMSRAADYIDAADTLIVGGTSLVVYPAAGLLRYFHGKNLVLINKGATPYDSKATLAIHAPIGETLGSVMEIIKN
jgi:NAD-dependent deacetylase